MIYGIEGSDLNVRKKIRTFKSENRALEWAEHENRSVWETPKGWRPPGKKALIRELDILRPRLPSGAGTGYLFAKHIMINGKRLDEQAEKENTDV
jgi:hypothetical protein